MLQRLAVTNPELVDLFKSMDPSASVTDVIAHNDEVDEVFDKDAEQESGDEDAQSVIDEEGDIDLRKLSC